MPLMRRWFREGPDTPGTVQHLLGSVLVTGIFVALLPAVALAVVFGFAGLLGPATWALILAFPFFWLIGLARWLWQDRHSLRRQFDARRQRAALRRSEFDH